MLNRTLNGSYEGYYMWIIQILNYLNYVQLMRFVYLLC